MPTVYIVASFRRFDCRFSVIRYSPPIFRQQKARTVSPPEARICFLSERFLRHVLNGKIFFEFRIVCNEHIGIFRKQRADFFRIIVTVYYFYIQFFRIFPIIRAASLQPIIPPDCFAQKAHLQGGRTIGYAINETQFIRRHMSTFSSFRP